MTRKKVSLAYITNDSERKASFKKRKKGLLKKVSELTTLCDVQACAIIYSPYDRQPEVWPNHEDAMAVIQRFRSLSEMDQTRKMFNQDSFNRERIRKTEESVRKSQKENSRKQLQILMVRCMYGMMNVSELDATIFHEMKRTIHNYLRDLQVRYEKNPKGKGKQVVGYDSVTLPPLPALPALSDYAPDLPPLDQFYNQSELVALTQNAGNQSCQFTSAIASGSAATLPSPVHQDYKFTGAFASSSAGNALPPPVNQEYEQFTGAFDPDSALVPIGSPYVPISQPQPLNMVEPSQPQAPNVMEQPPLQPTPGNVVEPTRGSEENLEAFSWNPVESPARGYNMGGGLGWEESMVLPPHLIFDNDLYNPNLSIANPSTYSPNPKSSEVAPGSGSGSLFNSSSEVAPGSVMNQNYTYNNPSAFNTFGSSDVAPGSGSLLNQDSTFGNPSGFEVAPGSVSNPSSTFIDPGTLNSLTDVVPESVLNPDPSIFNHGTFNPSSSNVAPGSVVNPGSTFNHWTFEATLGSVIYPNSAYNPWIYDVAPGSAFDPNSNFTNPSTFFSATFNPSKPTLASDAARGSGFNPSTFKPSNSTADDAPGSSNN